MKTTLAALAAAALACAATPALADATIDVFAANTVVANGANGAVLTFHFDRGGSYTAKAGDQTISGAWVVENGQLCLTPQGGEKSCSPHAANRKVGDTWTVNGADGVQYTVTIRAGR